MDLAAAIAAVLGVSWASGINLYAAVATLGCLHYFGAVALPGNLDVLANPFVIGLATVLYCVEFVADKVPYVDTCWDIVHTFIRVPAAAALAAAAVTDVDPAWQVGAFLLGGGIALTSHGSKAATRVAINLSPEPFTNSLASIGEDGLAFGVVALAILHPLIAIFAMGVILAITLYLLPKILRLLLVAFAQIRRFLFGPRAAPASVPPDSTGR